MKAIHIDVKISEDIKAGVKLMNEVQGRIDVMVYTYRIAAGVPDAYVLSPDFSAFILPGEEESKKI